MRLTTRQVETAPGVSVAVHAAPAPRADAPVLVLLHGFPQTHLCWRPALPALARRFHCLALDLRGYGASSAPAEDAEHLAYSKRAMAADVVAVLDALGVDRAVVAGHDRGARVAYRMALDHPGRVAGLAVLDVVPTADFWAAWTAELAMAAYHWTFLAQPAPLPERMIAADPRAYVDHILSSWSGCGTLAPFAPEALAAYRAQMADPARAAAMCADYRAGWHVDRALDEVDRAAGRTIAAPTLFLWGEGGFPARTGDPLGAWRGWAPGVRGHALRSGHFAPEEAPDVVAEALIATFAG